MHNFKYNFFLFLFGGMKMGKKPTEFVITARGPTYTDAERDLLRKIEDAQATYGTLPSPISTLYVADEHYQSDTYDGLLAQLRRGEVSQWEIQYTYHLEKAKPKRTPTAFKVDADPNYFGPVSIDNLV